MSIRTRLANMELAARRMPKKEPWRPWHIVEVYHLATPEEKSAAIAQAEAAYPGHRFVVVDTSGENMEVKEQ